MKTILFDIGNVLLAFDFKPALAKITGPNASPNAFEQIIQAKDSFEAGKMEKANYIEWASNILDFSGNQQSFENAWTSIFTSIEPMWQLAAQLKQQGHRLILFSNTNCIHAPYCLDTYKGFDLFDGAVFSHELGEIKPNDNFYLRAIEMYQLTPEHTYYIDDLPANIQAGRKFGFTSFQYDSEEHESFLKEFRNHLPV